MLARVSQFPGDENRDGSQNAGLPTIKPSDAAAASEHFIEFICHENFKLHTIHNYFTNCTSQL
jgi:hypothetical protein